MSSLSDFCSFFLLSLSGWSLISLWQSPIQVNDTGGPSAPAVSPPMPPLPSLALPAEAVSISYFLVSLFSRSLPLLLDILLSPQFASAPPSIAGSDSSLAKEGTFLSFFVFLLSNLSFYSSHCLSRYPELLQARHLYSELHTSLLFSFRYRGHPHLCLFQRPPGYLLPRECSSQL